MKTWLYLWPLVFPLAFLLVLLDKAWALSIPVTCGGMQVGTITMNSDPLGAVVGDSSLTRPCFRLCPMRPRSAAGHENSSDHVSGWSA
jgi:hypothetical protein